MGTEQSHDTISKIAVAVHRGAKFWSGVRAGPANRRVKNVLVVCCDGLPEAIEAAWPQTTG